MLSDRGYMRSDYPRESTSMLTWILCATAGAGVVQLTYERLLNLGSLGPWLGLSPFGIANGQIWTVFSYALLHNGIWHLLLNCLGIFLIGRELAPLLGRNRFLAVYLAACALGGLAWLTLHAFVGGGVLMGASAATAGLFILFACLYPEREITFLLFFVLPITVRPKILAWILLAVDGLGFLFSELPQGIYDSGVAHSAHLGGMLAGWIYYRYFHANNGWDRAASPVFKWPDWMTRAKSPTRPAKDGAATGQTPNLRAEVDRILDKINSQGFGALTDDEKRILDEAKDMLSRR